MKPLLDAMPVVGGLEAYFMKVRNCQNSLKRPCHAKVKIKMLQKSNFSKRNIYPPI
jgi:hypothetical protein